MNQQDQYFVSLLSASDSVSQLQRVHGPVRAAHPDGSGVPQGPVTDRPPRPEEVSPHEVRLGSGSDGVAGSGVE